MFVEKHLHLALVRFTHGGGRNADCVAILVVALMGEGVDTCGVVNVRVRAVEDPKGGEVRWMDSTARVVGKTLVALVFMLGGLLLLK